MITWESVDLPEPLGPMTATTSPPRTVRSIPRRISLPSTPARRPSITRSLIDAHHHLAVDDRRLEHRLGPGGRKGVGRAVLERERRAVLPALDLLGVREDLALRQRDVLVGADVADGVHVVVDAHDADPEAVDLGLAGGTGGQFGE